MEVGMLWHWFDGFSGTNLSQYLFFKVWFLFYVTYDELLGYGWCKQSNFDCEAAMGDKHKETHAHTCIYTYVDTYINTYTCFHTHTDIHIDTRFGQNNECCLKF